MRSQSCVAALFAVAECGLPASGMRPLERTGAIDFEWRPPRETPPAAVPPDLPDAPAEAPPPAPVEVPEPPPEPSERPQRER